MSLPGRMLCKCLPLSPPPPQPPPISATLSVIGRTYAIKPLHNACGWVQRFMKSEPFQFTLYFPAHNFQTVQRKWACTDSLTAWHTVGRLSVYGGWVLLSKATKPFLGGRKVGGGGRGSRRGGQQPALYKGRTRDDNHPWQPACCLREMS